MSKRSLITKLVAATMICGSSTSSAFASAHYLDITRVRVTAWTQSRTEVTFENWDIDPGCPSNTAYFNRDETGRFYTDAQMERMLSVALAASLSGKRARIDVAKGTDGICYMTAITLVR